MNEMMQVMYYFILPSFIAILIAVSIKRQSRVLLSIDKKELVIKALGLPDRLTITAHKDYTISKHCPGYWLAEVRVKYYDGTCEEHYSATKVAQVCMCPDCRHVRQIVPLSVGVPS